MFSSTNPTKPSLKSNPQWRFMLSMLVFMLFVFILPYLVISYWILFASSLWTLYFGLELQWMFLTIFVILGSSVWRGLLNYLILNGILSTLLISGILLGNLVWFLYALLSKVGYFPFLLILSYQYYSSSYVWILFDLFNKLSYFGSIIFIIYFSILLFLVFSDWYVLMNFLVLMFLIRFVLSIKHFILISSLQLFLFILVNLYLSDILLCFLNLLCYFFLTFYLIWDSFVILYFISSFYTWFNSRQLVFLWFIYDADVRISSNNIILHSLKMNLSLTLFNLISSSLSFNSFDCKTRTKTSKSIYYSSTVRPGYVHCGYNQGDNSESRFNLNKSIYSPPLRTKSYNKYIYSLNFKDNYLTRLTSSKLSSNLNLSLNVTKPNILPYFFTDLSSMKDASKINSILYILYIFYCFSFFPSLLFLFKIFILFSLLNYTPSYTLIIIVYIIFILQTFYLRSLCLILN